VNRGQKEAYKRDYAAAKAEGKPFFPYAVYKDLVIATIAIGIVVGLAIWQRVEVGEPVNPASTDFVPRPEWYFFFLFELLRIFKNQNPLQPVIMATFIIPNILMVLLVLWPFIDRGPERRPHKRPIAMVTAALVIFSLAYLTQLGAEAPAGGAGDLEISGLTPDAEAGLLLFSQNGCTSCHMLKEAGAPGPGPNLTSYGSRSPGIEGTAQTILEGPGAMPPFDRLTDQERTQLATLLDGMGTKFK
jgi:menaquinol-cytochrome c reductase cytochrome b/c subunit